MSAQKRNSSCVRQSFHQHRHYEIFQYDISHDLKNE